MSKHLCALKQAAVARFWNGNGGPTGGPGDPTGTTTKPRHQKKHNQKHHPHQGYFASLKGLSYQQKLLKWDDHSCSFKYREYHIIWWTLGIIIILMGISVGAYLIAYDKSDSSYSNKSSLDDKSSSLDDKSSSLDAKFELRPVDKVTTIMSFVILTVAFLHFLVFHVGWPWKNVALHSHLSEAFFEYSIFYGFALGVAAPALKYVSGRREKSFSENVTPFWSVVFLSMMLGLYLFQLIKRGIHIEHGNLFPTH